MPVYNEAKTVSIVITKLVSLDLGTWEKEIVIVNDCSTDSTKEIVDSLFSHQTRVFHHRKNRGKGAAIRTGLSKVNGDYIVIQDADLEYNPDDIKALLAVAANNPDSVIYGSRFKGRHEDTVFGHKAGNLLLTALTNLLYGVNISDMETCYKLIPTKYIRQIKLESNRFNFEPEITAKLLKLGVGILEVPINYNKRGFSEGKKIRWHDGIFAIWTLIKYRLT